MMYSPYDKSRIINYARWAESHKEAEINRLRAEYARNMSQSLEYEPDALINGESRRIIAAKTKGNQRYKISSYPGETFYAGDIVECYGSHWIIIEVESNKDICTTGIMLRCNHLFRFQNGTSEIIERWGVLDTGVYSTTVKETELQTSLNKQYKIYLPLDDETRKLYIGKRLATSTMKDNKYNDVLVCWRTTEFDDLSENYGDDALLILKCISDQYNPNTDSIEERICDYIAVGDVPPIQNYVAEITYGGDAVIRIGGSGKTFKIVYRDAQENIIDGVVTSWSINGAMTKDVALTDLTDGACRVVFGPSIPDASLFTLVARGELGDFSAEANLVVEAVLS